MAETVRVRHALVGALSDDYNLAAREEAASALGEMGDHRAVVPLSSALEMQGGLMATNAAESLKRLIGAEEAGQLIHEAELRRTIARLNSKDLDVRRGALKTLALLGGAGAVEPVLDVLREAYEIGDRRTAEKAVAALEGIGSLGEKALIDALKNQVPAVRWAVAQLLGQFGGTDAISSLTNALNDADEGVREAASVALERIQSRDILESPETRTGTSVDQDALERVWELLSLDPDEAFAGFRQLDSRAGPAIATVLERGEVNDYGLNSYC